MSFLSFKHNPGGVYNLKQTKNGFSEMETKLNLKSIFMKFWLIDWWPNDYKPPETSTQIY